MLKKRYSVITRMHNGKTDLDNFITDNFDTLEAAKKKYHANLSTYIGYNTLDYVDVTVINEHGNVEMNEYWEGVYVPEPEPIPVVPTTDDTEPDANTNSEGE